MCISLQTVSLKWAYHWQQMADLHHDWDLNWCIASNIVWHWKNWPIAEGSFEFQPSQKKKDSGKTETNRGKQMTHTWQFKGKGEWVTKDVCDALCLLCFLLFILVVPEQNPELFLPWATDYLNWQDLPPECAWVCVCMGHARVCMCMHVCVCLCKT